MKLLVKSREQAVSDNEIKEPHAIISIYTPGDEAPDVAKNNKTRDVLSLCFFDVDSPKLAMDMKGDAFGVEIAKKIVKFVKDQEVDTFMIHCDAGISRSSGVAAALGMHYNNDDSDFFRANPYGYRRYSPNMLVYRTVLNELRGGVEYAG